MSYEVIVPVVLLVLVILVINIGHVHDALTWLFPGRFVYAVLVALVSLPILGVAAVLIVFCIVPFVLLVVLELIAKAVRFNRILPALKAAIKNVVDFLADNFKLLYDDLDLFQKKMRKRFI